MSYIYNEMPKYFEKAYNAEKETREKSVTYWENLLQEYKTSLDFDGVLLATEKLNALRAADTIEKYITAGIVFFTIDTENSLYTFDYTDNAPEIFADYRSAAAFAEYNLKEMGLYNATC